MGHQHTDGDQRGSNKVSRTARSKIAPKGAALSGAMSSASRAGPLFRPADAPHPCSQAPHLVLIPSCRAFASRQTSLGEKGVFAPPAVAFSPSKAPYTRQIDTVNLRSSERTKTFVQFRVRRCRPYTAMHGKDRSAALGSPRAGRRR